MKGVSLVGDAPGCEGAYWFLSLFVDSAELNCDSQQFGAALELEGISGVQPGYPFFPTDQPWHRDAVVFGKSGMPWSLRQGARPQHFELPNAHAANREIVRVDVHESLGPREARDLVMAIRKVVRHYGLPTQSLHRTQPVQSRTITKRAAALTR
jgi:dTDP-4-amino-4,6-dideoxygalactose transaminase